MPNLTPLLMRYCSCNGRVLCNRPRSGLTGATKFPKGRLAVRQKQEIKAQYDRLQSPESIPLRNGNEMYEAAFREGARMALGYVLFPNHYSMTPLQMLNQIKKAKQGG